MKPPTLHQGSVTAHDVISDTQRAHLLFYSHAVSPCSNYVAYSTNFGHVILCDLAESSNSQTDKPTEITGSLDSSMATTESLLSPARTVRVQTSSGIYSLATVAKAGDNNGFLAAGYANGIFGYLWSDFLKDDVNPGSSPAPRWHLQLASSANSIAGQSNEGQQLFVGCSDGSVRLFDLGHGGRLIRTWSFDNAGDTDSSTSVLRVCTAANSADAGAGASALISDEAGFVRLLDTRQRQIRASFQPAAASPGDCVLARPRLGNWLTCLACRPDSIDWFACGGGPRLAIWHSANLTKPVATVAWQPTVDNYGPSREFTPLCAAFSPCDRLLIGGNCAVAGQVSTVNGELIAATRLSCSQAMSIGCLARRPAFQQDWRFTACGLGPRTDVCSKLGYRLFSMAA